MTTAEIKALPVAEKLQLMELLWEDMRERFDGVDVSQEVREMLDRRRSRVGDGAATLLEWTAAKATLGRC